MGIGWGWRGTKPRSSAALHRDWGSLGLRSRFQVQAQQAQRSGARSRCKMVCAMVER